jgi:hypothetical protein
LGLRCLHAKFGDAVVWDLFHWRMRDWIQRSAKRNTEQESSDALALLQDECSLVKVLRAVGEQGCVILDDLDQLESMTSIIAAMGRAYHALGGKWDFVLAGTHRRDMRVSNQAKDGSQWSAEELPLGPLSPDVVRAIMVSREPTFPRTSPPHEALLRSSGGLPRAVEYLVRSYEEQVEPKNLESCLQSGSFSSLSLCMCVCMYVCVTTQHDDTHGTQCYP